MKRLVLFDIDGTLLMPGRLWGESILEAIHASFPGLEFPRVGFGGKTDIQICREILTAGGVAEELREAAIPKIHAEYLRLAGERIGPRAHEVRLLPGAREAVAALAAREDAVVALLTGNLRAGARLKLDCVGLYESFRFGAFADDHWDRYELPAIAVARARKEVGVTFAGKQVVIIGDTVHDVLCGKSIGVRSIAVGTGRLVAKEDLLACGPDFYFPDLSDTAALVDAVFAELGD